MSRSLRKRLRKRDYEIRIDTSLSPTSCAAAPSRARARRARGSPTRWCSAYAALHRAGYAHSVETWIDGQLAGGLYGVSIGRVFFGESMFSRATDASKLALAHLARQLERWQFGLIDCQMATPHLASLGAREIPAQGFHPRPVRIGKLSDAHRGMAVRR